MDRIKEFIGIGIVCSVGLATFIFVVSLISRGYEALTTKKVDLLLANSTPYEIQFVLAYPKDNKNVKTQGWYSLDPGEIWEKSEVKFPRNVEASFYVFAKTKDHEFVRWLHSSDIPKGKEPAIYWESLDLSHVISNKAMDFVSRPGELPEATGRIQKVGMTRILPSETNSKVFSYVFAPPIKFPNLYPKSSKLSHVAASCLEAKSLAQSLHRQKRFLSTWHGQTTFPFHLGLRIDDKNGPFKKGVAVYPGYNSLPQGEPMPFQPGDILVSLDLSEVYSNWDVGSILYDHATDHQYGGIDEAIPYKVVRNGKLYSGYTTYWFDYKYWSEKPEAPTEGGTLLWSAWDGVSFGFGEQTAAAVTKGLEGLANGLSWLASKLDDTSSPNYIRGPSYKELKWRFTQAEAMRRQWHGESYKIGEFGSYLVSLPRAGVKAFGGKTASRFASSTAGRMSFEIAENIAWSLTDGSPVRTDQELINELRLTIPIAAVGSIVPGVFKKLIK